MPEKLKKYKLIKKCRLCDSKIIKKVYSFGNVPIGNDLKKNIKNSVNSQRYPLELMNCQNCNHFQLSVSINPKILFAKNYTYLTGITKTFKNHFQSYAKWIIKNYKLKKKSFVVEIGSNDGTCLEYFRKNNMNVLGIDPAKLPANIAKGKGINTINKFFNKKTSDYIIKKYGKADFITSHNVLAHTENNKEIFKSIFRLLKKNGYFCFEIGYFYNVIKKNLFDTIYHEHLDYHHAKPLVVFLEKIGFSIIDLSTNNIQGGTLRLLMQKREIASKRSKKINKFLKKENLFFKMSKINFKFRKFQKSLKKFNKIINKLKLKENKIFAYGSPTKASLLLVNSRLNINVIKYSFEDNKLKCGKYIPGTDIKIINTDKIRNISPKIIVILAWNFKKEIIEKLKKHQFRKIKIITPLPIPKVNII